MKINKENVDKYMIESAEIVLKGNSSVYLSQEAIKAAQEVIKKIAQKTSSQNKVR